MGNAFLDFRAKLVKQVFLKEKPDSVSQKLEAFASLKDGWHYGSGLAPTLKTIELARELNQLAALLGFSKRNVFPGKGGEITFVIYDEEKDHSFQISPDATVRYWDEAADDIEIDEGLAFQIAKSRIISFALTKWHLSFSWISNIGTPSGIASGRKPLSHPQMGVGSRQSTLIVSGARGATYAHTRGNSTLMSVPSRPYSDVSREPSFQSTLNLEKSRALRATCVTAI